MHEYGTFGNKVKFLARVNSGFVAFKHFVANLKGGGGGGAAF